MKNDYYCLRSEEEHHVCNGCKNCYCYDVRIDTVHAWHDVDAEIERQIARSEAMADRM